MTDNEIIKALECLSGINILCKECAYHKKFHYPDCRQEVAEKALDLINRQKAEIERLKAEADQIAEDYSNLVIEKDELFDEAEKLIKKAKAEAVKEFAERLKEKESFHYDYSANIAFNYIKTTDIDNLLKETVGDAK
jgi:hypothetical protein